MGVGSTLARVWSSVVKATEGQVRSGPWSLPISGGILPADVGSSWNWWQRGYSLSGRSSQFAMVEACVSAYAQTVAMCPGDHWRKLDEEEGRKRVTTSALSRILRKPNEYQSISDFLLNVTRCLYLEGNAYALALRNDRFEIDELHIMDPTISKPQVSPATGEVFYRLGGNSVIDYRRRYDRRLFDNEPRFDLGEQLMVPARDVFHVRLHAYEHRTWPFPLVGQSPLIAVYGDLANLEAMKNQQKQFYDNQARPSAVLSTDLLLDKDQVQMLRDRWNEQAKGLHAGGVPILTAGLKVQPWSQIPARDAQTAELLKLTEEKIALVFRVPLAVLGLQGTPGSIEQLMNFWLASGLGFCLNQIEESFDRLFNLRGAPEEYTELDTDVLMRSARKERIDWLVRAVQGGIYSPNEARMREDMPAVEYGEEPRVQQQVVPLSAAAAIGGYAKEEGGGGPGAGPVGGGPGSGNPLAGAQIPPAPSAPPAAGVPAAAAAAAIPSVKNYYAHQKRVRSIFNAAARYDRTANYK